MTDVHSPDVRSFNMSRVRSTGNATTELRIMSLLRERRLVGWRRHLDLPGKPDFAWPAQRVALFVHGCFWHGHDCGRNLTAKTNRRFWKTKIDGNHARDKRTRTALRRRGWIVVTIWECQLKRDPGRCLRKIERAFRRKPR